MCKPKADEPRSRVPRQRRVIMTLNLYRAYKAWRQETEAEPAAEEEEVQVDEQEQEEEEVPLGYC